MGIDRTVPGFRYNAGVLEVDGIAVEKIADLAGTPTYVYSAAAIRSAYQRMERAFAPLDARLHYAVKACANLHVCRLLNDLGAGMDVVSGGEMERAWLAGAKMKDIVFAGVAKTEVEILAALDGRHSPLAAVAESFGCENPAERGPVGLFNVESEGEIERIATLAGPLGLTARISIRVNPNVDPRTHEHTTTGKKENKFGIDADQIPGVLAKFGKSPELEFVGLHVHIGSPVRELGPYREAVEVLLMLIDELQAEGHTMHQLDLGGGWAVDYFEGESPQPEDYAQALIPLLAERVQQGLRVVLEPGRSILANAGALLTRVQYVKRGRAKRFVICDAGMHTLIRPVLYQAFHFVWPARVDPSQVPSALAETQAMPDLHVCDVVGPICESGDFLARDRALPEVGTDDIMVIFSAGAYGMSMSSNYNDHGRPAEVLVEDGKAFVVNERQKLETLLETERSRRELDLSTPAGEGPKIGPTR